MFKYLCTFILTADWGERFIIQAKYVFFFFLRLDILNCSGHFTITAYIIYMIIKARCHFEKFQTSFNTLTSFTRRPLQQNHRGMKLMGQVCQVENLEPHWQHLSHSWIPLLRSYFNKVKTRRSSGGKQLVAAVYWTSTKRAESINKR